MLKILIVCVSFILVYYWLAPISDTKIRTNPLQLAPVKFNNTEFPVFKSGQGKSIIVYESNRNTSSYALLEQLTLTHLVVFAPVENLTKSIIPFHGKLIENLSIQDYVTILVTASNFPVLTTLLDNQKTNINRVIAIDIDNNRPEYRVWLNQLANSPNRPALWLITNSDNPLWVVLNNANSEQQQIISLIHACKGGWNAECLSDIALIISGDENLGNAPSTGTTFVDKMPNGSAGPRMKIIPTGTFGMGSRQDDSKFSNELPRHKITISQAIAVAIKEISVAEYREFMLSSGYKVEPGCWFHSQQQEWLFNPEATWQGPIYQQTDNYPVTCVNRDDAEAYTTWLSQNTGHYYRLPSEAEFEWFNRNGYDLQYGFVTAKSTDLCNLTNGADENTGLDYANSCNDGFAFAAPVGSFGKNRFGLYDTTGNIWELTQDCWNSGYAGNWRTLFFSAPNDGSAWQHGDCLYRVIKGGSWLSSPKNLRASMRDKDSGRKRLFRTGFRVVRELTAPGQLVNKLK